MNLRTFSLASLFVVASALSQAGTLKLLRHPAVSGNQLVFVYAGDLWTSDISGDGMARRLTSRAGIVAFPHFSPDGKWLAFTASYDGPQNVYVMPAEGGEPRRVTFDPEVDEVAGWTPDGKIAYRTTHGSFTPRKAVLWTIDPQVGGGQPTAIQEFGEGSYSPDGQKVAYCRQTSDRFNWRRYRGGSQGVISIYDLKNNAYRELDHGRENAWRPMWIGNDIYYLSDKNLGTVNLFKYDSSSNKTSQLTNFSDHDMKWAQTDGKQIVYERNGGLYAFSIGTGVISELAPKIATDDVTARPYYRRMGEELSSISISPSGTRVAGIARGIIFSIPAKSGETKVLYSHPSARAKSVQWSADGKELAFISDESGSDQIYVIPATGGEARRVSSHDGGSITSLIWSPDGKSFLVQDTNQRLLLVDSKTGAETEVMKTEFGYGALDISPDSKWIAITASVNSTKSIIYLYDVVGRKLNQVSEGYFADGGVSFDQNGKYLYFVSARTVQPELSADIQITTTSLGERIYVMALTGDTKNPLEPPIEDEAGAPESKATTTKDGRVDLDGIQQRIAVLPMPAGQYGQAIGGNNAVFYVANGMLTKFDFATRQSTTIMPASEQFSMNPGATKVAYVTPSNALCVTDIHPNITPSEGRVDTSGVATTVDPRAEWKQMYWEAWRFEKDQYYDKNMLGIDWKAMGDNYAALLPQVGHRSDLDYVMGMLQGELGTGHAYVYPAPAKEYGSLLNPVPVGQLGVDITWNGDTAQLSKIYRGFGDDEQHRGPLGQIGINVRDGEYLLAIDGKPVTRMNPPGLLLMGKVGQYVTLTINDKPSIEGARKVVVKPIGSEATVRYAEWIEANRKLVDKLSGGRLAYMHVPNTAQEGIVEFTKALYSQSGKEAIVVDERFNGGGFFPSFFIEKLQRQSFSGLEYRNSAISTVPRFEIPGPKVMLINGFAGSGGDMFPWLFRENKLGPLLGKRTWGGLMGYFFVLNLIDGGQITSPQFGTFDFRSGEWIAENKGIDPDIDVDARPDLIAKGQDPQLEQAVKYLLDQLQKQGPRKIKIPAYPHVGK
ncbi:MAG: PD40 domain-containing protein [Armatimonadetes bacterium]|nr:PD40 domain-containing protein [Armatimonadota bacterium]